MNHQGGRYYRFDVNFVMRSCLVLTGSPIALKIESFKDSSIRTIASKWDDIRKALIEASTFVSHYGFTDDSISAYNALIPIVYYIYKSGTEPKDSYKEFRLFFIVSQLKGIFRASTNNVLSQCRNAIDESLHVDSNRKFGMDMFANITFGGNMKLSIDNEFIEQCLNRDKGEYTFMLLSLLYGEIDLRVTIFHQDHVHPDKSFKANSLIRTLHLSEAEAREWIALHNKLPNLELLAGDANVNEKRAKSLPEWIDMGHTVKYCDGITDYHLSNFKDFYEKRKDLMKEKLTEILRAD